MRVRIEHLVDVAGQYPVVLGEYIGGCFWVIECDDTAVLVLELVRPNLGGHEDHAGSGSTSVSKDMESGRGHEFPVVQGGPG